MKGASAWTVLKKTGVQFNDDNALRLSASLGYYAMFSIGPLLALVVWLIGLVFGAETTRHYLQEQFQGMLGVESAKILDSMIEARHHGKTVVTTIVGIVILLFGAAGVFAELQSSLNTIWQVQAKPGRGLWTFVRDRFLSFTMVLGVGFLLLVSLVVSAALSAFTGAINRSLPTTHWVAQASDFGISFVVIMLLFAMIFKFLPDVKVPWSKVWVGAGGTTLLFVLGKFLLGLYLGRQSTSSSYGEAGSVIVIMMWIYYASVILFAGAEFTQVYAAETGAQIELSKYATPVPDADRTRHGMNRKPKAFAAPAAVEEPVERPVLPEVMPAPPFSKRGLQFAGLMFASGLIAGIALKVNRARRFLLPRKHRV